MLAESRPTRTLDSSENSPAGAAPLYGKLWSGVALGSAVFAFGAGVLSSLSPCVLPILPIVLGAAVARHRGGPMALAACLALSFACVGLFIATIGLSLGLDAGFLRTLAAL